ncbi:MAG TPA: glycoside hydrolase family 95 protein [Prolixibacteraceae bacterium]|jgi:alpha-L-fucosidase 2
MKKLYCLFLFLFGWTGLMAQQVINPEPASIRTVKISAEWTDRAQVFGEAKEPSGRNVIWYQQPAKVWEAALPLGNGRLGAMVFGGVADERIQLNESTLWDGYSLDPNDTSSLGALPEVRRLLFEGKNNESIALAEQHMMGKPKGVKPYQSLGELWFDTPALKATNYVRSLDLSTAIATTTYTANGVSFKREVFISPVNGILVIHITSDKKAQINLSLTLKREQDATCIANPQDPRSLILEGKLPIKDKDGQPRGLSFEAQVKAVTEGGKVWVDKGIMHIENATGLTLFVAGATSYPGLGKLSAPKQQISNDPRITCSRLISKATVMSYDKLRAGHVKEHQRLFNRVDIHLGDVTPEILSLPTDKRLQLAKEKGSPDAGLVELFFQFGRYLLISSSRPGAMPANLQGLWAWQMNPPWNADFHTNINLQMNYWPAEITNLSEMHLPLFDLTESLVKPGEQTASILYGARGWVVHHLTDAWGFTAPADGPQGIWPMGAAWLSQHPW